MANIDDASDNSNRGKMPQLMLAAAIGWADRGMRVFPLQPRSKVPFPGSRGCKDATQDEKKIRRWWTRYPDANIGIATGNGLFVVDLDGQEAEHWYIDALGRHGAHPETLTVGTARGWHLFFWSTAKIPNSVGRLAPHIDIRGTGGSVVAAPSVHPSGHVYELVKDAEIVEAPQWLVDLAMPDREPPRAPRPYTGSCAPAMLGIMGMIANAPKGQRNALLYWGACRASEMIRQDKITLTCAHDALFAAGRAAGLYTSEIQATINSAFRGL